VGAVGDFAELDLEAQRSLLRLNAEAVTVLCHVFLRQAEAGDVLMNVSSVVAFVPQPAQPLYCASKAFVTSWSLAFERELRESGANILVHALCPGPTVSEFMSVATNDTLAEARDRMPVERCVRLCLEAVDAGRLLSIPGPLNRFYSLLPRLLPVRLQTFLARKGTHRPPAKFD